MNFPYEPVILPGTSGGTSALCCLLSVIFFNFGPIETS